MNAVEGGQEVTVHEQCVSHTDNTTKFPGYGSHVHTIFDAVATLPLHIVVCGVLCKLKLIVSANCVDVR